LDVYYNGSRLTSAEYTANNGTYITLATGSSAGDIIDMLVYSYQVGAFSGVGGTGTANQVAYWDTTNSITGSPNFTVSGSTLAVTGSFTVITGSTAEFTVNPTGVRIGNVSTDTHTITGSVNMSGSFSTIGTITAQTLVVQTVTSSVSFITGSTRFGTLSSNTHLFTGSMSVTGGLVDINKDGQSLRIFPQTSSGSARIQMQNSGSGGLAGANAIIAVESSTGADQFTGTSPFSFVIGTATQKAFHLGANSAVVMTITGSNVGIGTSSPQMPLSVQANTGNGAIRLIGTSNASSNNAGIYWYDSNDSTFNGYLGNFSTSFDIYNQRSTPMAFYTAGTERMRITSAGYTKISNTGGFANTSATAHHIQNDFNNDNIIYMVHAGTSPYGPWINFSAASPNNTTNYFLTCQDSTQSKIIIYSNGNIVNRNGSYGTLSDITLKENIVDATPKLNDLLQLKVRNFNMIGFEEKQIGFIAQEFEEVFPKMIDIDGKTGMKTIKTSVLVPMLVKALQEANAKITALEEKLERNNIQ